MLGPMSSSQLGLFSGPGFGTIVSGFGTIVSGFGTIVSGFGTIVSGCCTKDSFVPAKAL